MWSWWQVVTAPRFVAANAGSSSSCAGSLTLGGTKRSAQVPELPILPELSSQETSTALSPERRLILRQIRDASRTSTWTHQIQPIVATIAGVRLGTAI